MQRFTEIYYDDALRFAQYIQATEGGDIELVREDSVGFPMPAKNRVFGDMVDCLKIRNIEIAFLESRKNPNADKKHKNRSLYRYIIGQRIREIRELNGMSLEDLSAKTDIQANNLRNIESGRLSINTDMLCLIANALDAHVSIVRNI
nr:MAG TPA: helix-turn-helix domain protein [Caudoviricetes sp.]